MYSLTRLRHIKTASVALASTFLFASCGGDTNVSIQGNNLQVPVPDLIRTVQAVSNTDLELRISIDGNVVRQVPASTANTVETSIPIPVNETVELGLAWYSNITDNQSVLLADQTETIPGGENDLQLNFDNYINSGAPRFDDDGDQRTNLSEVRDNRNPLSAVDHPVQFSTANFLPANLIVNNDGVDNNTSGDSIEPDQKTAFSVWHNGSELNLYICGQDQTLSESSEQYWHDDTVFVFFDGNNSDNNAYDGVDDYQIAFVRSTQQMIISQGSSNPGCGDESCITFRFYNSSSSCQYEMSATFGLQGMNISTAPGSTFGFDIEITDDDNGGLREDAAQWIGYDDRSDLDPSTFGTLELQN